MTAERRVMSHGQVELAKGKLSLLFDGNVMRYSDVCNVCNVCEEMRTGG